MESEYHYPPEVFNLLVDTIPLLCKSKNDVIIFFKGSGVSSVHLNELENKLSADRKSINKYEIVRTVLQKINERGDSDLRARREIIKRIVEFEQFSTCWPNDQMKAKGCVAELRSIVNVKDSFTKMNIERKREKDEKLSEKKLAAENIKKKKQEIENLKREFFLLFSLENKPQERGKHLEKVLNNLFKIYGILIKEDFKRKSPDCAGVIEQIDGVVEFDGNIYIVEMKWVKDPIGVDKIAQHLVRLFNRGDARAIFITSNGYADTTIAECREVLSQKTISLCTLQEIVFLLENQGDLVKLLRKKVSAATVDKEPFIEVIS